MLTIYSDDHRLYHGRYKLIGDQFTPCFEKLGRTDMILNRVKAVGLGEVRAPCDFGLEPIRRVYSKGFVRFLQNVWQNWLATDRSHDMLSIAWLTWRPQQTELDNTDGRLGYYPLDAGAPITAGTRQVIASLANVTLSGQSEPANGARSVFSLCRLPGHHAAVDYMGGYCFFNNAATAAQAFFGWGAGRVAILDADYHHGSGIQDIFYNRTGVLFTLIHGDPCFEYPYFLGYADEKGNGVGIDYNFNYPLAAGSDWATWSQALQAAIRQIQAYTTDVPTVSLGVGTFKEGPISQFRLDSLDYLRMGEVIGELDLATLFVMEGGYAVEEIGINVVNVLQGFEGVHQ